MNALSRFGAGCILLCWVFFVVTPFAANAQNESDRRLYDDPVLFEQLSTAKQILLELKFGKKPARNADATTSQKIPPSFLDRIPGGPGLLSAIVNTLVNNASADASSQDTQSETSIVLGSGNVVIAGFNDSGSHVPTSNNHFTGSSQSTDNGTSWTDLGILPASTDGDAGDPVMARNATTGTVYLATLAFTNSQNLEVFRSTNNGASWNAPSNSAPGFTTTTGSQDKEWIAVDNFPGTGNGNVYQFWRNFGTPGGMQVTRSLDDGVTWGPSGGLTLAAASGQGASVIVGIDHAVYCFWLSGTSIVMRKSTDQAVSFAAQTTVTTLTTTGSNGDLGLGGGFRTNAFPQTAINPVSGNIYMVYNDKSGADKGNIYFTQSTNGGSSWSAPVTVNDDSPAGTNDQWQPAIAARPDGTGLSVCWYDRRTDPSNSLIERWGVTATISGSTVTFGPNFKISPPFGVVIGVDPVINSVYMGDYDQMTADNSFYYTTWGDNRDQSIAVPSRKNANVRIAKFPQAGPGPVLEYVATAVTGGNGNAVVDPNECNTLTISLKNSGTTTATGISARISAGMANVTLPDSLSAYPNTAAGTMTTNSTIFRISTSPAFTCGTPVTLTMIVTSSAGTDTFSVPLPSASAGQFDNNTVTAIPDNTPGGVNVPIVVSGIASPITDVNVSFYITHTFDSDLMIRLVSPDNTVITLANRRGSSGDNFGSNCTPQSSRTTLDDASSTLLSTGTAPFIGTFKPDQALSTFNGKSGAAVNGTWNLRVIDTAAQDVGSVQCWSLFIAPSSCPDGGGVCTIVPIQLAAFSGSSNGNNSVTLEWTTISELNNYGFDMQRSAQQSGPFETLPGSFLPGHGTTLAPQHYQWTDLNAQPQFPYYRLKQTDLDGTVRYFDPIRVSVLTDVQQESIPTEFFLAQNYPNPFNPSTVIKYGLPSRTHVRLEIFNTLGQRMALLVDGMKEAGYHQETFTANTLATGVYFYKLTAGSFVSSKKLLLVK